MNPALTVTRKRFLDRVHGRFFTSGGSVAEVLDFPLRYKLAIGRVGNHPIRLLGLQPDDDLGEPRDFQLTGNVMYGIGGFVVDSGFGYVRSFYAAFYNGVPKKPIAHVADLLRNSMIPEAPCRHQGIGFLRDQVAVRVVEPLSIRLGACSKHFPIVWPYKASGTRDHWRSTALVHLYQLLDMRWVKPVVRIEKHDTIEPSGGSRSAADDSRGISGVIVVDREADVQTLLPGIDLFQRESIGNHDVLNVSMRLLKDAIVTSAELFDWLLEVGGDHRNAHFVMPCIAKNRTTGTQTKQRKNHALHVSARSPDG